MSHRLDCGATGDKNTTDPFKQCGAYSLSYKRFPLVKLCVWERRAVMTDLAALEGSITTTVLTSAAKIGVLCGVQGSGEDLGERGMHGGGGCGI